MPDQSQDWFPTLCANWPTHTAVGSAPIACCGASSALLAIAIPCRILCSMCKAAVMLQPYLRVGLILKGGRIEEGGRVSGLPALVSGREVNTEHVPNNAACMQTKLEFGGNARAWLQPVAAAQGA